MDTSSPPYLRARIDMYRDVLSKLDASEMNAAILRNGVFPKDRDEKGLVEVYARQKDYSTEPLSFSELCTFNTWFTMYPEKVCGTEEITTSREFPITIKGDMEWIENTIGHGLGDFRLLLSLPGEWRIDNFEPTEDFFVQYRDGDAMMQVFAHGVGYNLQVYRGEQMTELRDFSTIEQANGYALMLMQKEGSKPTNAASLLEMEALALEIELQMNDQ
ncbi:MAG: hypothetical protein EBR22_04875 [Cytophagia bacterium]|nr:hypothetical protein [Cytophagia bacterium]